MNNLCEDGVRKFDPCIFHSKKKGFLQLIGSLLSKFHTTLLQSDKVYIGGVYFRSSRQFQ
jgi:hypothetical protein